MSDILRKDIFNTTAFALVGRAGGFFIPLVIAAYFGSTSETDVFFLIYGFALCLTLIMGHLFEIVIVPHISDEAARGRDVNRLIGAILIRSTLVIGLLLLATIPFVKPLLRQFTQLPPDALDLAFQLSLVMAPMPLLASWTGAFNGALNVDKAFHVGALSPIYRSVTVIAFMLIFHQYSGIFAIAIGFLLGECFRFSISLRAFLRHGHRLELTWAMSEASSLFFGSAAYQMVGFALLCFIPIINQITASWLEPGNISVLAYALQLRNIPSLLFTSGISTVVLSHWAEQYSQSSSEFGWPRVGRLLGTLFVLAATCAVGLILFRQVIASLAFGWGAFPSDDLPLVGGVFAILVLSLPFDVATLLCVNFLTIVKSDATYMLLALFKLALLIVLNCLLVPRFGLYGIAIAMATTNAIYAGALFLCVVRHRTFRVRASFSQDTSQIDLRPCHAVVSETTR